MKPESYSDRITELQIQIDDLEFEIRRQLDIIEKLQDEIIELEYLSSKGEK